MSDNVHLGHRARKRFGQNFLNDPFIIDGIVSAINPRPGQNLLEIGPGLGALTEPVAAQVDKLTVVELDRDLAERLRHHPKLKDKLTIHEAMPCASISVNWPSLKTSCAYSVTCLTTYLLR